MSYRILSQPGADAAGVMRRGVKITGSADTAINKRLPNVLLKQQAEGIIENIRAGAAGTGAGVYAINGHQCYHSKFGGQAYAVAWRAPPGDTFCYIEAIIAKIGAANAYAVF